MGQRDEWNPDSPRRAHVARSGDWAGTDDRPLRLDLADPARQRQTLRLARAQWEWGACLDAGWDRDDLTQELLLRVLQRQSMPSCYDPARGSVGKYIHVLTRSVLRNLRSLERVVGSREEQLAAEDLEARAAVVEDAPEEGPEAAAGETWPLPRLIGGPRPGPRPQGRRRPRNGPS